MRKWVVVGLLLMAGKLEATDIDTALADTKADFTTISQWWTDQTAEGFAYASGTGVNLPARITGFPGFEVGFSVGSAISPIDKDGFKGLSLKTVDPKQMEMLSALPVPAGTVQAKISIPGGFDIGAKYGTLPAYEFDSDQIKAKVENTTIGLEVRKQLLEIIPVTVYANYAAANGLLDLSFTETQTSQEKYTSNNVTTNYTQTMKRTVNWNTKWNTGTAGAGIVVSKGLLFFTPFAGVGISKNLGETKSTLGASGTVTLHDLSNTIPDQTSNLTAEGSGSKSAEKIDVKIMAGFELSMFLLKLNVAGEISGNKMAANAGLRFQF